MEEREIEDGADLRIMAVTPLRKWETLFNVEFHDYVGQYWKDILKIHFMSLLEALKDHVSTVLYVTDFLESHSSSPRR